MFHQSYFRDEPLLAATNSTLTLSNVTFAESGEYHAVVTNALGRAISPAARLDVLPLLITSQRLRPRTASSS